MDFLEDTASEILSNREDALLTSFEHLLADTFSFSGLIRKAAHFLESEGDEGGVSNAYWKGILLSFSSALLRFPSGDIQFLGPRETGELQIANAVLHEKERHFRQMSESAHESFWLAEIGARPRLLYIAPACKNILGLSKEELCGKPNRCFGLVHKADRRRVWRCYREIVDGRLEGHEFRVVRPDGAVRWIHNEGWPLTDNRGVQVGIAGVLRDITATKQLQEELISISEHEQRHLMDELNDGICQHLAGTSLVCKVLYNKMVARKDPAAHDMARICQLLSTAVSETRQLSESLNPVFAEEGLGEALKRLSLRTSSLFSVSCIFRCGAGVAIPNQTVATHLYGIAKEAVNRAIRRGDAGKIRIRLRTKSGQLFLTIFDNGNSFTERTREPKSISLRMMAYRASETGGRLKVERGRHGGTLVTCAIPTA